MSIYARLHIKHQLKSGPFISKPTPVPLKNGKKIFLKILRRHSRDK